MRVTDAHAHFWDVQALSYPWIEPGSPFDRTYTLQAYQQAAQAQEAVTGLSIERMVFVECDAAPAYSLAEARWVTQLARQDPRIQGIVARVALTRGDPERALDELTRMPLVKGIRDNIQNNPAGFALRDEFVRGVHAIVERNLHFELCLKHHQLTETIELVRGCPRGSFVLDHCAKPDIKGTFREPWRTQICELAALPNVVCKISGLVTEADWQSWQEEDVLWFARQAAEAFGPERILFGSDWPVNEVAGGLTKWMRVARTLASAWSEANQARFFRENAERIYRLGREGS